MKGVSSPPSSLALELVWPLEAWWWCGGVRWWRGVVVVWSGGGVVWWWCGGVVVVVFTCVSRLCASVPGTVQASSKLKREYQCTLSSVRLTDRNPYACASEDRFQGVQAASTRSNPLQLEGNSCFPGNSLRAQEGTAISFASEVG